MASRNVTQKLIDSHLVAGEPRAGEEIALRIDQTLTQDATGTLVMLTLESMGLRRVRTEVSAQYVDHNIVQQDHRNAEDHIFLHSGCRRFGIWFSRPGNGVSHPVHMERLGKPGRTLLGSDSHTCAGGSLGMLAIGAGGLEVAMAMAGEPFHLRMPAVWGVRLDGTLPPWVSAKDVILEMLRRHGVSAGLGRVVEYHGPGLASLSAMDRHVIANMGAELGATTTVFPSDDAVRTFLAAHGRGGDFEQLRADDGARYDVEEEIDLSSIEPLIAKPSSPGKVVPVREVAGEPIHQAYIGSSANPGYRDFAVAARMVEGRRIPDTVSFDVNPTSEALLETLMHEGLLEHLVRAGARLHQAGCNGCIGMGQAPARGRNSLRTVPRNFPGRSGTREDSVFLCSPETATASALRGVITDPRDLGIDYPEVTEPPPLPIVRDMLLPPPDERESLRVSLVKGDNIVSLPELDPIPRSLDVPVLLVVGDDVSTDEILPAGTRVLPYRSNIPKISEFCFDPIDETYASRAREAGDHAVVGGRNYGQGSSREHAALAPRYLGLRVVLARSFARIHRQNLVNYGVLPLVVAERDGRLDVGQGDRLVIEDIPRLLERGRGEIEIGGARVAVQHELTTREQDILRAGGLTAHFRARDRSPEAAA